MPPKAKEVSELGFIAERGNGWGVIVHLPPRAYGPVHYGRVGRANAQDDLAHIRRATTREEMRRRLKALKDNRGGSGCSGRENGDNAGGSGGSAGGAGISVSEAATAMHKRPSDGTSSP